MLSPDICVSVCMITYNHENYISQAIEGILKQETNFPVNLIIGEDCSTDNTRKICLRYKEIYPDRITLLLPDVNLGMRQNFVNTYQKCTGKYIAFCEGDDYWIDPYKLQKQFDFLETNSEYGLVHTNYKIFRNSAGTFYNRSYPIHSGLIFDNLLYSNEIGTLTVMLRSDLLKNISNADIPQSLFIDYSVWLHISRVTKIHYIDDIMAVYRELDESVSNTKDKIKAQKFKILLADIKIYFAQKYNCLNSIIDVVVYMKKEDLKLGFYENQKDISDQAFRFLKLNSNLSVKDYLFYYINRCSLLRFLLIRILKLKNYQIILK